ncbi:MAG: RecQ family ATP-dependent DNA helicase [Abditibacteriales bacterium]|nr:RecQ family ATP-dependent DNA helicase [Abditibacteriales bacterium]
MSSGMIETLRARFGFTAFRAGQAEAIESVLAGQHTLVVMPTGAGKSLIYQFAALHQPGVTVVISPLIALMKDQVDSLTSRNIAATYINSTLSADEQSRRLHALVAGKFQIVYIAPERLRSAPFQATLRRVPVGLLAVDEAHCISQWGYDFRPDYLRLAAMREQIGNPVTVALTATATPQVQDDIVRLLGLPAAQRIITGFNRPNLTFEVHSAVDVPAKLQALQHLLRDARDGAVIVYVGTRRDAEEVAEFVREVVALPAQHYHAGLDADMRARVQDEFMAGALSVVVATNAFGMGVDRPDVRLVVHFNLPGTLEAYYQEAGRAGRDGAPARAVLLYSPPDRALQEWFIENDAPTPEEVQALYDALRSSGRPEVWTTTDDLSLHTGLHEVKVRVGLAQLEAAGCIERLGDEGTRMGLRLGEWNEAAMRTTATSVADRRRQRRAQLRRMVAYAESNACRRRILLNHFGDPSPADAPRCCDNCLAAAAPLAPAPRDITSLSPAEKTALIVLDTVRKLKWEVGRGKLAQILRGSKSKEVQQFGYDKNPHYGKLSVFSLAEIEGLIDQLIALGYFKLTGGDRPVLRLTPRAEAALQTYAPIPLQLPREVKKEEAARRRAERETGQPAPPQPDEHTALIILDALRQLRWGVGREKLADILKGSQAKEIQQWDYDKNPHYGKLSAFTQKEIRDLIEQLIEQGYLRVTEELRPVLRLTAEGEAALNAQAAIPLRAPTTVKQEQRDGQPPVDTVALTMQMFADGLTPAQIAERRGLSVSTIYTHLSRHIGAGELSLSAVVPDEVAAPIRAAIEQVGDVSRLALIKALLPETVSYGEINCVVEAWKREQDQRQSSDIATISQPTTPGEATKLHPGSPQHLEASNRLAEPAPSGDDVTAFLSRPHPRPLLGSWHAGWALDFHSRFSGSTWQRSGVGELVHRLKYQNDRTALMPLVEQTMSLCAEHPELMDVDAIVPVPPSQPRPNDPVRTFAAALSGRLNKPVRLAVTKTRSTQPQKDLRTLAQKKANVAGAFAVQGDVRGKRLLVVDDLFDSGATLEEVTRVLRQAGAAQVCVLTLTRTIHTDS